MTDSAPLDRELAWDLGVVLQEEGIEFPLSTIEGIAQGLTAKGYSKTGDNDALVGMVSELTRLKPLVDKIANGVDGFLKGTRDQSRTS